MIKRFIKNELSLKRYRSFVSHRRAVVSFWILVILTLMSAGGEFIANSKPILLKFHGSYYTPVLNYYHPSVFGSSEGAVTDFRKLELGANDWALWPPSRFDPFESDADQPEALNAPSHAHWMGTDDGGRDVFARLLYGYRYSMGYAVSTWIFASIIGVVMGAIMGFFGGWVDLLSQRWIEVWESLPVFLLLMIMRQSFNAGLVLLVLLSAIFGWTTTAAYTRAEFLKLRRREFVEAARALGANKRKIIFNHLLPNSLTPFIMTSSFVVSGYIVGLANLDYLGFGLQAPTPSWGELLNQAQKNFQMAWWLALFPSLALFVVLICMNYVGEGVREALDPRKS